MFPEIINLVIKHTKYKSDHIIRCDLLYSSYTNKSYWVTLKDDIELFVKVAINGKTNKINEGEIIKLYYPEILIYSGADGVLITHWIDTLNEISDFWKKSGVTLISKEIESLHKLDMLPCLSDFNYLQYDQILSIHTQENDMYYKFVNKWCCGHKVVSHNDINQKNMLLTKTGRSRIILIDFEWATKNYDWWDYVNYIAEQEIYDREVLLRWSRKIKGVQTLSNLYELLFIRWWFCRGWAEQQKNTLPNMDEYLSKCVKNITILIKKIVNEI